MRVRLRVCGRFRMLLGFFQVTGAGNWNGSQRKALVSGKGTGGELGWLPVRVEGIGGDKLVYPRGWRGNGSMGGCEMFAI